MARNATPWYKRGSNDGMAELELILAILEPLPLRLIDEGSDRVWVD